MSPSLHLRSYFAVPNSLVDDAIIHHLSLAEIRTLLYILRRTYGFQKTQDAISETQFLKGIPSLDSGTGLCRNSLRKALKALEAKGLVQRLRHTAPSGRNLPTFYAPTLGRQGGQILHPSQDEGGQTLHGGGGNKVHPSEGPTFCTPQNKEIQIYTKGGTLPTAGSAPSRVGRAEPPSLTGSVLAEPTLPQFESESLKRRWERIYNWWNQKRPLDSLTPYERRLAYRQIEELVRDPDFEPPPPGWKPPTFEEILEQMGMQNKHKGSR